MTRDHVLTLDLHDDPALIDAYDRHHAAVWPEVEQAILDSGVEEMRIYRLGARLVMLMRVNEDFNAERKAAADRANPAVQRWEREMERFQKVDGSGDKWQPMRLIYALGG